MIRQLAAVLRLELDVLRFYANRVYEKPKVTDPDPGQKRCGLSRLSARARQEAAKKPLAKPGSRLKG